MGRTRTTTELIADVRLRADDEDFRTDAEIKRYLNQSIYKLYGKLIAMADEDHLVKSDTISVTAGTSIYDLPSDCHPSGLKFFRVTLSSDRRMRIEKATTDEIDVETRNYGWDYYQCQPKFRMYGQKQVRFIPEPQAAYTVTVEYVPQLTCFNTGGTAIKELSADTDYFDGQFGWEEWIVLDSAIKIRNDQEEDVRALQLERAEAWDIIETQAASRVQSEPSKIRDVYGNYDYDGVW